MRVPIPEVTRATGIDKTSDPTVVFTTIGTKIVAPNIAHTCCIASKIQFTAGGLSLTPNSILLFSLILSPLTSKNSFLTK